MSAMNKLKFKLTIIVILQRHFAHYYSAKYVFNPQTIKKTTANFTELPPRRISVNQPLTKAAVFIPLCEVGNKVSLLYTLRTPFLKAHRGQVSFPGGKHENTDNTFVNTAIRETVEELGLESNRIEIWCSGQWMNTRKGFSVVPVVGRIKNDLVLQDLNINTSEVQEVFTISLEELCKPSNLGYTQVRTSISSSLASVPVYLGGKHKIWGLTAFLTYIFLKCLLPKSAYSHPILYIPPIPCCNKN